MSKLFEQYKHLPLAFGCASISGEGGGYGFGQISQEEAINLLHQAFERGIRVFDTAPIYGFGLSEKRLGQAFEKKRDKVFIVSKCGVSWHDNRRVNMTNDPQIAQKMLEQSLRDLRSEYIDLYMIHWPDQRVDIRKTLEVLVKAQDQGKIQSIGLCNTHQEDLHKAFEVAKIDAVQSQFNIFEHSASELFTLLDEKEIAFMSWGTLDKGILSGRVDKNRKFDSSDCRSWAPWWKSQDFDLKFEKVGKMKKLVEEKGHSLLELALAFNLKHQQLSMALVGAKNTGQLDSLIKAFHHRPTEIVVEQIIQQVMG